MTEVDHEAELLLSLDGLGGRLSGEDRKHGPTGSNTASRCTTNAPAGEFTGSTMPMPPAGGGMNSITGTSMAEWIVPYAYTGPAALLADFYREVERILKERGAL